MAGLHDEREARFLLGRLLADVYENECAAELFRDAIRHKPEMAKAHVELGFVLGRAGDFEKMTRAFGRRSPSIRRPSGHQFLCTKS